MTPERWQQVKEVLQKALELKPEERAGFLAQRCGEDSALRREVETLIASEGQTGSMCSMRCSFRAPMAMLISLRATGLGGGRNVRR